MQRVFEMLGSSDEFKVSAMPGLEQSAELHCRDETCRKANAADVSKGSVRMMTGRISAAETVCQGCQDASVICRGRSWC